MAERIAVTEHFGVLDLAVSRPFSLLICVVHGNGPNRDGWHSTPNQT